jgi:thiamine-phosphate pyrophosphorylase
MRDERLENVTPAVARALDDACTHARLGGAAEVQPLHLLLALLAEMEGIAAQALGNAGLDFDRFFARYPPSRGGMLPLGEAVVPLSASTQHLLRDARSLAGELCCDRIVTSEQLVFALLRHDEGLRTDLETLGLNFGRLEANILDPEDPPLSLDEPLRLTASEEEVDTARILDAAANRAREALRVLEDYCRFVLDDALLSRELKELRHSLVDALADLPARTLFAARETLQDVGTRLHTQQEQTRHSLAAVVRANWKRLQEALRTLEEYGKLWGPELGRAMEAIRYRSYTVEKAWAVGADARQRLADARLYLLVTGASCTASPEWTIRQALSGGVQIIQLREKGLPERALLDRARQVRQLTHEAGMLFIVNDRPDIAKLAGADGVHLGQEDLPVKESRRLLGPDALIGVSTHTLEQVKQAVLDGASYLGVGPTFPSSTKTFDRLAGLEFVRRATAETSLPIFALGGITLDNLPSVLAASARRVAVSSAICRSEDPRSVAAQFRTQLEHSTLK